jgi:hypothetical protein
MRAIYCHEGGFAIAAEAMPAASEAQRLAAATRQFIVQR